MAVKNPGKPSTEGAFPFQEHKHLLTDPVFLIGNGTSRKTFDLERLRNKGTIIGCNALYREFSPDLLIAIDAKMLKEINKSEYWKDNLCMAPANRSIKIPNTLTWKTQRFNTSGCFAMRLISEIMKPKECYMLGMDSYPGNIFDGTENYAANTLQNFKGVIGHCVKVLQEPSNTMFINVNEKDAWGKDAHATGKYRFMTFKDFEKQVMK